MSRLAILGDMIFTTENSEVWSLLKLFMLALSLLNPFMLRGILIPTSINDHSFAVIGRFVSLNTRKILMNAYKRLVLADMKANLVTMKAPVHYTMDHWWK